MWARSVGEEGKKKKEEEEEEKNPTTDVVRNSRLLGIKVPFVHLLHPNHSMVIGVCSRKQVLCEQWAAGTLGESSLVRDESIISKDVSICPNHFILE